MELKSIMDIEIKTKSDARNIVRYFNKHPELLKAENMKQKQDIAFRYWRTGCFTNLYDVSCIKEDSKTNGSTGNCYKVYYKKEFIGFVAQFHDLWYFSTSFQDLLNSPIKEKMKKVAIDKFIQSHIYQRKDVL
ncbi:hypothetical protein COO16_04285 [Bacillus pseudomycoides]|uniref:hypothetical protein n=1 Tax=Bacillus pseudomycoides TaxID=64104 RepID=UPI000BED79E5|nr:hypothetical protein [Bacillus pseudomycoides]PDY14186.1 hypothetical protein COO16_04285 [Bacillus pseudomycoides]